jgi:hypothetical protein
MYLGVNACPPATENSMVQADITVHMYTGLVHSRSREATNPENISTFFFINRDQITDIITIGITRLAIVYLFRNVVQTR